jgi:hypothetical protein
MNAMVTSTDYLERAKHKAVFCIQGTANDICSTVCETTLSGNPARRGNGFAKRGGKEYYMYERPKI